MKRLPAVSTSQTKAAATLSVAEQAGAVLEDIARAISCINERNLLIASASKEQAQVSREVDRNLVSIRDWSMQTSAGANQSKAASQNLANLAVQLNQVVMRFRL